MRLASPALFLAAALLALPGAARAQEPDPVPTHFTHIYQPQAQQQVDQALQLAAQQHKRVLLDFGTDNCANCQVLNTFFHRHENNAQLAEHFIVVHVDVGPHGQKNSDLAQRYGVHPQQSVPDIAVVSPGGQVLAHDTDFDRARNMSPTDLTSFLNKWRQ